MFKTQLHSVPKDLPVDDLFLDPTMAEMFLVTDVWSTNAFVRYLALTGTRFSCAALVMTNDPQRERFDRLEARRQRSEASYSRRNGQRERRSSMDG